MGNSRSSIISKSITMFLSGTPFYRIRSRNNVSPDISFRLMFRNLTEKNKWPKRRRLNEKLVK